jgi:hypothetical protein
LFERVYEIGFATLEDFSGARLGTRNGIPKDSKVITF